MGDMERVQVWLTNEESDWVVHEHFGQSVVAHIRASRNLLGECEATPEAVAELADVPTPFAEAALSYMGTPICVGKLYHGDASADLYLVVYPDEKR